MKNKALEVGHVGVKPIIKKKEKSVAWPYDATLMGHDTILQVEFITQFYFFEMGIAHVINMEWIKEMA